MSESIQQSLDAALLHQQAGKLTDAEAICRNILSRQPDHPGALHLLGMLAARAGHAQAGVDLLRRAIAIDPTAAEYHVNLGTLLEPLGKLDEAAAAYRQSIALRPNLPEAHNNLGNVLAARGELAAAESHFREAARLNPSYADAFFNLANVLHDQKRFDEAVDAHRQAIALRPDWPPYHNNLADSLRALGRPQEAVEAYERALAIWPAESPIIKNLGDAHHAQGQVDQAIASYQHALELRPDFVQALVNLANAFKDRGQISHAIAQYDRAIAAAPDDAAIASNRVYVLTMHPEYDAPSLLRELKQWDDRHASQCTLVRQSTTPRRPPARLRIGYVSADFRNHVIGRNILPLFRHRNREAFEVTCYYSGGAHDAMTEKFQGLADRWRDIARLTDDHAAALIAQDQIDILVDLAVHSAGNRLPVFARRPAPLQVTFAGYPGGTGLSAMDWRLTDPHLDPPEADGDYVERSYRLPHSFWCYDPEAMQWEPGASLEDAPQVNALPALANGHITFGCLNTFAKINQGVLTLWARVLAAVKNSRLLVMAPEGDCRQRVLEALASEGVAPKRALFTHYQPRRSYLRQFDRIDVALDTFPYNGHTASLDALWMGVPVVTLVGKTVVGRAGWSQLSHLGLRELVARTPDQYVQIAAAWAADLPRLAQLRQSLRLRMLESPLTDGPRFAADIEAAYRFIWDARLDPAMGTRKADESLPASVKQSYSADGQYSHRSGFGKHCD